MRTTIEPQQTAFYTQNGHIEFELSLMNLFPLIEQTLPSIENGRDIWRHQKDLETLLLRKFGPIALTLSRKKQLHLGCDQWITKQNLPQKMGEIKEIFSLQGLAIGAIFSPNPVLLPRRRDLGIIPAPSEKDRVLFFNPHLLLDWPHVASDLYVVLFTLPRAVYVQNPKDPLSNELKKLGYNFGDVLKNQFHPLIQENR